jgi:hypothetical protein
MWQRRKVWFVVIGIAVVVIAVLVTLTALSGRPG